MATANNNKINKCFIFVQQDFSRSKEQKDKILNKLNELLVNSKKVTNEIETLKSFQTTITVEQYTEIEKKFDVYRELFNFDAKYTNDDIIRAFSNEKDNMDAPDEVENKIKETTKKIRNQKGSLISKLEELKSSINFSSIQIPEIENNSVETGENINNNTSNILQRCKHASLAYVLYLIEQLTEELRQFIRLLPPPFRKGAEKDKENTEKLFKDILKFDVESYLDKTKDEFLKIIDDFTQTNKTDKYCSLVFIISTHGNEAPVDKRGPQMYLKDDLIPIDDVIARFKNDKCSFLSGRNKIFFIQACRGSEIDTGTDPASDARQMPNNPPPPSNIEKPIKIPIESDFIIHYSTPPGYLSWRDIKEGSYFIECLCKKIEDSYSKKMLVAILMDVHKTMSEKFISVSTNTYKQMPTLEMTIRQDFYLTDKIDDNNCESLLAAANKKINRLEAELHGKTKSNLADKVDVHTCDDLITGIKINSVEGEIHEEENFNQADEVDDHNCEALETANEKIKELEAELENFKSLRKRNQTFFLRLFASCAGKNQTNE